MTFSDIRMLFLIWAVPAVFLLYVYGMRKRRRVMRRFAAPEGLAAIAPGAEHLGARRWVKVALICLTLLLCAVSLAGPRYGYSWKEVERKGIDIIIALDCSRSMLAEDTPPTRLDRAKREIVDLLDMLQGDRVGLVAFAGTAFLQCPLTLDYGTFHLFLETLTPDFLPVGGTDLAVAVTTALSGFDPAVDSEKAIILISDGEPTASRALEAAQAAAREGVKLFTIGVGRPQGVPIPAPGGGFRKDADGRIVLTRLDEKTLQEMALATGGTYVRSVAGDMDLDLIYTREIRAKMDPASLARSRQQVWENRYQWALGLAVVLLAVELLLPLSSRRARLVISMIAACMLLAHRPAAAGVADDAQSAYDRGDFEQSLKLYLRHQVDAPQRPEVLYNIGNAYYKLQNYDAAAAHYEKTAESADPALRQQALYNLGNADFRRGRLEAAIEHYQNALDLDPDDRQARDNLEFVRREMTRRQEQPSEGDQRKPSRQESAQENQDRSSGAAPSDEIAKEGDRNPLRPASGKEQQEPAPVRQRQASAPQTLQAGEAPRNGETPPLPQDALDSPRAGDARQRASQPPATAEAQAADRQAARQILNRLTDKPGMAMMPAYGPRRVEKDW